MSDDQIIQMMKKRNFYVNPPEPRLYSLTVQNFLEILQKMMYECHINVSDTCRLFFRYFKQKSYTDWIAFLQSTATKENEFMMGTINLIDFFYKIIGIDMFFVVYHNVNISEKKREHVFDYLTGMPALLRIEEEELSQNLKEFELDINDIQEYRVKLLSEGAMQAELDEKWKLPTWAVDIKKFYFLKESLK